MKKWHYRLKLTSGDAVFEDTVPTQREELKPRSKLTLKEGDTIIISANSDSIDMRIRDEDGNVK